MHILARAQFTGLFLLYFVSEQSDNPIMPWFLLATFTLLSVFYMPNHKNASTIEIVKWAVRDPILISSSSIAFLLLQTRSQFDPAYLLLCLALAALFVLGTSSAFVASLFLRR